MNTKPSAEHWSTTRGHRGLALGLAVMVLAVAVFAVSHVHGVSDPRTHHHLLDLLIFAQSHSGFLLVPTVWILLVLAAAGRAWPAAHPPRPFRFAYACRSRAPPSLP